MIREHVLLVKVFENKKLVLVRGTILIPCRIAMKGSFPLNDTYFQVNEVSRPKEKKGKGEFQLQEFEAIS